MCLSVVLPVLLLTGCSHTRRVPVAVAIPKPVLNKAIVPVVSDAPPGGLAHWQAGSGIVYCFAFSPDGKQLTTVDQSCEVKVWDPVNGKLLHSFQAPDDNISEVVYSPNGRWIASRGDKKELSFIDIFNAHTRHLILRLPSESAGVSTLRFSHDSNILFAADKKIRIWDTRTWRNLYHLKTDDSAMLIPNGQCFVRCSTDGIIRVCDARTGRIVKTWREARGGGNYSYDLKSISNGGETLLVSYYDNGRMTLNDHSYLRFVKVSNSHLIRSLSGDNVNSQAAFSPHGDTIANWSFDNIGPDQLAFWNVRTGQYKQVYSGGVLSAAFSPDGKTVAMSDTMGGINIFRVPNWK